MSSTDKTQSLGSYLLKIVFGVYLAITLVIVVFQSVSIFEDQRQSVLSSLQSYEAFFGQAIATALWNLDDEQLKVALKGVMQLHDVIAVKVVDLDGNNLFPEGTAAIEQIASTDLISYRFELSKGGANLGHTELFASLEAVRARAYHEFLWVLAVTALKAFVIWLVFMWAIRKFVVQALDRFIERMEGTKLATGDSSGQTPELSAEIVETTSELKRLHQVFNQLKERIESQQTYLQSMNNQLEERVVKRTEQLQSAMEAAEAANLAKSRFLASMSHEIRTPMNGIMGMLRILEGSDITEQDRERLKIALNSADDLLKILNDILDLSKIESDKLQFETATFFLGEIFADVASFWMPSMQNKGITFTVDVSGLSSLTVRGDLHRIRQMVNNLISNAFKFTREGEISVTGKSETLDDGRLRLQCEVRDTGIGIAPDNQELIFNAFEQADDSTTREFGGTGLGLSIVRKMCELMDGNVKLESVQGEGSCFQFSVVLEIASEGERREALKAQAAKECVQDPSHALRSDLNILLVEDNAVNQMVAKSLLEQLGLNCDVAEDGERALAMLRESADKAPYELLLMDCQMPVMDGFTATAEIRSGNAGKLYSNVPIIALTANAMKGDRELCLERGMDDFLSKPIDLTELNKVLVKWCALIDQKAS